jgi:hypothetical protein
VTLSINDTQHKRHRITMLCHYADCHVLFNVMLNIVMLCVVKLSIVMLSVVMLSVVAPNSKIPKNMIQISFFGGLKIPLLFWPDVVAQW